MSELSKLLPQAVVKEIKGLKFKIKPLCMDDMAMISDLEDKGKRALAMKKMIQKVINDSFPDATDDEINRLPIEVVTELIEEVADINGLSSKKKQA